MDVFGLEPVQATILITVIGVALQIGLGFLQSGNPFDVRKLLTTAIIAIVLSFTVVSTVIESIPAEASELTVFITLVGVIGTIAGIDALVKNTSGAIAARATAKKASKKQ